MGRIVGAKVAERFGKSLLELGGNNAIIITPESRFGGYYNWIFVQCVGTCGQRCTSTRRLIIHESVYEEVKNKLSSAYKQLKIGNPLDEKNHVGPLIDKDGKHVFKSFIEKSYYKRGRKRISKRRCVDWRRFRKWLLCKTGDNSFENYYEIVQDETFAPILYLMKYSEIEEAIDIKMESNRVYLQR